MTKKNTRIKFTKTNLENIKHHEGKREKRYFATNCAHLCMAVYPAPSVMKSYYAHWSIIQYDESGKQKRSGRYKYICRLNAKPLDEVMNDVTANIKKWSKEKKPGSKKTVGTLASAFMAHGSKGYRVKIKGKKIKYKNKTRVDYNQNLNCYVLLNTKKQVVKDLLTAPFKFNGSGYVTGALKDVPLDQVSKRDIEIWHTRMEVIPTAANRALAALSVAFEWDMKRSTDRLYKGDNNPCLRISKFQETKDKNFLLIDKVIEVRNYCINEQWRDPHFLTFYILLLEVGERLEDIFRLVWKKPKTPKEIQSCSGWVDYNKGIIHLTDSKDRNAADVPLTIESVEALKQLEAYKLDRAGWSMKSIWVFPRATEPSLPINNNSYRVKLKYFNYKFGLATRDLVRVNTIKRTGKNGKRKLYKYKNEYTFKHLRKTFVTHYARSKDEQGHERGLVQASLRMRHSSPKVTKDHYFTEDQESLRVDHMYEAPTAVIAPFKKEQK